MAPVKTVFRSAVICLLVAVSWASAGAQDLPSPAADPQPPAHISLVDGVAILERDGEPDDSPANMPLLAGDRVRTRTGRVEILFGDGSTLHLDHHTTVDLQSDELVRLVEGRIRLAIPGPSRQVGYRVDGPHGWAHIAEPGEYRIALMNGPRGSELELAVLRGRAELVNEDGRTPLRAGERAFARAAAAPSYAYVANSAAGDAFDRWSDARRSERLAATAQYLPDEVRPYAASLEQHGYWRDEPTYGRVWYPRVDDEWRPYYRGRWVSLRPYGWTWIAHDPWGWPTHHYGRWGYSTGRWFWIPGRSWGAAWVSWAYAGDYVSWCPLGWNNRPVFQIHVTIGRGYDPWRAWTVVPRGHFGVGYVHRTVVRSAHLDYRTRGAFAYADRGPEVGNRAVPRGSAPIRLAGTRDHRRGTSPVYTNLPADRARTTVEGSRLPLEDRASRPEQGRSSRADDGGERAVSRDRMVPDRPAIRSERPGVSSGGDAARRPDAGMPDRPANDAPSGWGARPGPRAVPPPERRAEPGTMHPAYEPRSGRAMPREYGRSPRESSPPSREPGPQPRESAPQPRESAPQRRESGPPPRETMRPNGGERSPGPAVERRGADRPAAGSYERRAPEGAARPRADQPSRPSGPPAGGPPAGARPRPGGGR